MEKEISIESFDLKTTGAISTARFSFGESPIKKEYSPEILGSSKQYPWIPFFTYDGHFERLITALPVVSPTHSSCINSKVNFAMGGGFIAQEGRGASGFLLLRKLMKGLGIDSDEMKRLDDWEDNVNPQGETLAAVTEDLFRNYESHGNAYLMVRKFQTGSKKDCTIHSLSPTKCKVKEDKKSIYVSPNWDLNWVWKQFKNGEPIPEGKVKEYGNYPNWTNEKGAQVTIIHIKKKIAGWDFYGLPPAIAALMDMYNEYNISSYNKNEFGRQFRPDAVLQFVADMNEREAKKFLKSFYQAFQGQGKNGGVFAQVVKSKDLSANVINLKADYQGSFSELRKDSAQSILTAHQWHPQLASIQTPGKLGGSDELPNIVFAAHINTILPLRRKILGEGINRALKKSDCFDGVFLTIANNIPITYFGSIDPKRILTINEQREAIGREPLSPEEITTLKDELRDLPGTTKGKSKND